MIWLKKKKHEHDFDNGSMAKYDLHFIDIIKIEATKFAYVLSSLFCLKFNPTIISLMFILNVIF